MDTSNFKEVFESPKVKALTAQVAALELEAASLRSVMADVINTAVMNANQGMLHLRAIPTRKRGAA